MGLHLGELAPYGAELSGGTERDSHRKSTQRQKREGKEAWQTPIESKRREIPAGNGK